MAAILNVAAILNSAIMIFYVGHIVCIQCMSIYDFVLIRLTDFELESKTRILDQITRKFDLWPLLLGGPFLENFKNTFTSLFVWSSRLIVLLFVHIGRAGTEQKAKM